VGWAFFYMFVILKIPVCAALYIVWWASREPEPTADEDSREGGGSDRRDHPRPRRPRPPRRGPHAGAPLAAPQRVRRTTARQLRTHR
jgi:hypothetical protein